MWIKLHALAVFQGDLFGRSKCVAVTPVVDPVIDPILGQAILLRRSRSDVASVITEGSPRELDANDLFEIVVNVTGVEYGSPCDI